MNAKHTPGPWIYDETWALINAEHGSEIAAVHAARGTKGEPQANARLIAAAPDLLAALVDAYERLTGDRSMIRAAIAKATGQQ